MVEENEDTLWAKIRATRARLEAVERRKPRETRDPVTWARVYAGFLWRKKPLDRAEFVRLVSTRSGQPADTIL